MCTLIQFPGFGGIAASAGLFFVLWLIARLSLPKGPFLMDPLGKEGAFLPLFSIYLDLAKFVIGLASGSVAVLVGAATYRSTGPTGHLLESFASPLYLLAASIVCGVLFMAYEATDYEEYRHKQGFYTRFKYSRNLALGYSTLICFALGYAWLIVIVTGQH
jgi:hypothetical protein